FAVLQTDSYPHCADIMVNSMWDPQTEEVAAFEHLVGSHGGLGGERTRPFVLYPAGLPAPVTPIGARTNSIRSSAARSPTSATKPSPSSPITARLGRRRARNNPLSSADGCTYSEGMKVGLTCTARAISPPVA